VADPRIEAHVRILVHNADDMVTYLEQTFDMTPVKVQVYESRGMKNAIYQVGETASITGSATWPP
jgi:hypothetical protein